MGSCHGVMVIGNEIAFNHRNGIFQRGCNDNQILNNFIHDNDQEQNLWTAATSPVGGPTTITTTVYNKYNSGSQMIYVFGGTGAWAALNGPQNATYLAVNQFTIPADTSSFGSLTGQVMWASAFDGIQINTNGETGSTNTVLNGNRITNATTVASATYVSGVTFGATCLFSLMGGNGTGAIFSSTGTLAGGAALTLIQPGAGYSVAPTSATVTGTGCSGTALLTSTLTTPTQRYAINLTSSTPASIGTIYGANYLVSGNVGGMIDNGTTTQYPFYCGFMPCLPGTTILGQGSLQSNTGAADTATGYQSLLGNTSGLNNTANGYQALFSNTTGYTTCRRRAGTETGSGLELRSRPPRAPISEI